MKSLKPFHVRASHLGVLCANPSRRVVEHEHAAVKALQKERKPSKCAMMTSLCPLSRTRGSFDLNGKDGGEAQIRRGESSSAVDQLDALNSPALSCIENFIICRGIRPRSVGEGEEEEKKGDLSW